MMDGHTVYLRKYSTGKHDIDDGGKCGCDCRVGIAFKLSDCIVESDGQGGETVRIKNKDLTALICPKDEFQYYFGDLALRNGADDCELIAVVSDGADYIHNMVETLFGSYVHIRDIWHTKECIGKYFLAIYAHDTQKGHELADKLCTLLEEGKLTKLLKELEPYKDITADEDGSKLVHPYSYIYERCDGMEYDLYKLLGLPIGSGTMESTNKCFHRRMRTTGALWTKLKANRMVMTIATNEAGGENLILSILIRMENVLISIKDNIDKDKISRKYQKPAR